MRAKGTDRWLLFLHFCHCYIVDTLLIYGSMWFVALHENQGIKIGHALNLGMKEASLILAIYSLIANFPQITKFVDKF